MDSPEPEMLKAVDNVAHTYEPKLRETKKQNLLDKLEAVAVETAENKAASFQREKLQDLLESMEKVCCIVFNLLHSPLQLVVFVTGYNSGF